MFVVAVPLPTGSNLCHVEIPRRKTFHASKDFYNAMATGLHAIVEVSLDELERLMAVTFFNDQITELANVRSQLT